MSTFEWRAVRYAESLARIYNADIRWDSSAQPHCYTRLRFIVTPYPVHPASFASALHELGHIVLGKVDERQWLTELTVSRWALLRYDESDLPGLEQAKFGLGRCLSTYLVDAAVSRAEAERVVPAELLVSPHRLAVAA
jgi:hypothetical protein